MSLSRGAATPAAMSAVCDQAGAVDPLAGPAAPEIGRLEKALGDRDKVGLVRVDRREMAGLDMSPSAETAKSPSRRDDRQPRAERQRHARRQLDARPRIGMGAQRGDPVSRRARRSERRRRQIADVAVARELDPAPASRSRHRR